MKKYVLPVAGVFFVAYVAHASLTVDPVKEGVSTAANQTTAIADLASIVTNTTGVATAANQTTGNTTLASILSGMATAANQATANGYLSTIAANSNAQMPVSTATLTQVANAVTSTTLAASNSSRKGIIFYNNSTTNCAVAFGGTASMVAFTIMLQPGTHYEMPVPVYQGIVTDICTAASGSVNVTEF